MRTRGIVSRALLFAGVSGLALAVGSTAVRAADLTVPKAIPKAMPLAIAQDEWNVWIEGAGFWTGGEPVYYAADNPWRPKFGGEIAGGVDYRFAASPWHLYGQARYGQAERSGDFIPSTTPAPGPNTFKHKESHSVFDFGVGRDIGIGLGRTQLKFGIRIADIRARSSGSGNFYACFDTDGGDSTCSDAAKVTFDQRSRFLGGGPRIGIEGTMPLAPQWTLDYMAGFAVLFGGRQLKFKETTTIEDGSNTELLNESDLAYVANLDASAGVSYWFGPAFKLTAGYRFDGYWKALKTFDPTADVSVNVNRFFHGPFLRLTAQLGGPGTPPPPEPRYPGYNWTGLYIGGNIGGGWGTKDWENQSIEDSNTFSYRTSGFLGGGQAGFNYQITRLVLGMEGDISGTHITGSGHQSEDIIWSTKIDWITTLAGRFGYATGPWLWYAKAGAAWVSEKHTVTNDSGDVASSSTTRGGYVVGGGVEYAWAGPWTVKLEYNYMNFGVDHVLPRPEDEFAPFDNRQEMHVIKAGLNYRFGAWGKSPVVAKY
jgi:outer membrane immunogenic protein